jgi:hypothetical protein
MNPFVAECLSILTPFKSGFDGEDTTWFDLSSMTEAEAVEAAASFEKVALENELSSYDAVLKYLPFKDLSICCRTLSGTPVVFCVKLWAEDSHPCYDLAMASRDMFVEAEINENGVSSLIFGRTPDGKSFSIDTPEKQQLSKELLLTGANTVRSLIGLCIRSKAVAYKPVANPKNAARAAKGKKPLFDWVTVEIKSVSYKNTPLGGTHASPRQHDRRGFFRTMKSGKRVWIRQTKVGKASNGVIFHDYKIAPLTT